MVTINPAKQLRIDKRVGSLEVGKDADVVIWNHHPLSTEAIVDRAYIDGIVYYDRVKDLDRVAAIENEKGATRTATAGGRRRARRPRRRRLHAAVEQLNARYNANGAGLGDHQRAHRHGLGRGDREGTIVIKGNRIDAVGENVTRAGRREGRRRRRRERLSRASSTRRPTSASTSRARATTTT